MLGEWPLRLWYLMHLGLFALPYFDMHKSLLCGADALHCYLGVSP